MCADALETVVRPDSIGCRNDSNVCLGNSGNSSEPHLHFQIMDSRDFFTANGLPVMFENIPLTDLLATYPIKSNALGFSDNLYSTVR